MKSVCYGSVPLARQKGNSLIGVEVFFLSSPILPLAPWAKRWLSGVTGDYKIDVDLWLACAQAHIPPSTDHSPSAGILPLQFVFSVFVAIREDSW